MAADKAEKYREIAQKQGREQFGADCVVHHFRPYLRRMEMLSGVFLIVMGALLITGRLTLLAIWAQRNGLYFDLPLGGAADPTYLVAMLAGLLSFLSSTFAGDLVQWTDEKGTLHFSDSMDTVPAKYRGRAKLEKLKEAKSPQHSRPRRSQRWCRCRRRA